MVLSPKNKVHSDHPRITSQKTDKLLLLKVKKNPHLTAADLKRMHPKLLSNVALRTIHHKLQKDLGMPSR